MCTLFTFSHANWTYDNLLKPLDQTLGNDNKLHDHSRDDQEGLECTLVGHLEKIGCLKEYFVIFVWQTLTQPFFDRPFWKGNYIGNNFVD